MKKITFIILFFSICLLALYSYMEQKQIIQIIKDAPIADDVVRYTPDLNEVTVADVFTERNSEGATGNVSGVIVTVDSELAPCTGVAEMDCMVVDGQLFYDSINGFKYEEGYVYQLEVEQIFRDEPIPADVGTWYYKLINIISKDVPYVGTALSETSWVWESYTEDGNIKSPKNPESFVMKLAEKGHVSGTTDCNNYSGSYVATDSSIDIGPLVTTRMACFQSQEGLYHNLLGSIDGYVITDDFLTLTSRGYTVMVFSSKEKISS